MAATFIIGSLFSFGCNDNANKGKNTNPTPEGASDEIDDAEQASAARGSGGSGQINVDSLVPAGAALLDATFQLTAKAAGIKLCDGVITMRINAAIGKSKNVSLFELPTSEIDCGLIGKLNLKPIVGVYSDSGALPNPILENNVLHFDRIGTTTFNPPRPFLPSFLASSRSELKSVNTVRTVTVNDGKRNKSASGQMTLKMLSFGVPYRSELLDRSFSDTFSFESTAAGFDGIDKAANVIFDRIAMTVSLNPVAVLSLSFSGDAKSLKETAVGNPELIPGPFGQLITVLPDSNSTGVGGLIGSLIDSITKIIKVDLQLTLKQQGGLKTGDESSLDSSDDGVQVGR